MYYMYITVSSLNCFNNHAPHVSRYCLQWHRIVQGRVNPEWWDNVMAPLEQLELAATNDSEEMELQTRALTEPLPTNQQVQPIHDLREI
jgi:xeroderma pigmentosum group C-complementing protein